MAQHRFPFAPFLASSFIVSSFAVHAGIDVRRVPRFPLDATTGALVAQRIDLATVRITQGAAGSVRLHRLFALTFAVSGEARIGTNSSSLLGTGADYELGGDAGGLLRLYRGERFQISLRSEGGYHGGQQAGVARFYRSVRAIADRTVTRLLGPGTDFATERQRIDQALTQAALGLTTASRGFRISNLLTAAWTLSSYAGLQAMLGFSFDRTTNVSNEFQLDSETSFKLSTTSDRRELMAGAAIDLGAASTGVPLDVVAEYELLPLLSRDHDGVGQSSRATVAQRLALGVYYSGRTDLQLGMSAYTLLAQLRELGANAQWSGKAYNFGGLFVFRYIW